MADDAPVWGLPPTIAPTVPPVPTPEAQPDQVAAAASASVSPGVPNNNPTNVHPIPGGWPGQIGVASNGVAIFDNIGHGWNAGDTNLVAKVTKHGLTTFNDIIGSNPWGWAPRDPDAPDDKGNDPEHYVSTVGGAMGFKGDDPSIGLRIVSNPTFRHSVLATMANKIENPGFNLSFGGGPAASADPAPASATEQPQWGLPPEEPGPGSNGQDASAARPVYDPINGVGRNPDGSVAYLGPPDAVAPVVQPKQQPALSEIRSLQGNPLTGPQALVYRAKSKDFSGEPGSATYPLFAQASDTAVPATAYYYDTAGTLHSPTASDPAAIAAWKKDRPLDISNMPAKQRAAQAMPSATTGDAMDAFNQGSFGLKQGLVGDVGGGLADLQARLANLSPIISNMAGAGGATRAQLNAQAGARVLQRSQAETALGGNPYYGAGELTGQVTGTLPIMALTGGLGDAVGAAAEGSRLAPALDFLGGRSTGLARIPSLMASGAQQGAEANVLASGGSSQTLPQQAGSGAITGAALGPVAPALGYAATKLRNLGAPQLSQNAGALANDAIRLQMPVTGLQIRAMNGDSNAAVKWSNGLSQKGTGFHQNFVQQKNAWTTNGVGALFGGDGTGQPVKDLSSATLGAAQRRIGASLNGFAARNSVPDTGPMIDNLNTVQDSIDHMPVDEGIKNGLRSQIGIIRGASANGTLSGQDYTTIIRHGGDLSDAMHSDDPAVSRKASQIRGILDDAMAASASPEDQAGFRLAQAQYKNLMTVQRAARNTNIEGQITPNALNTAVNHDFPDQALHGTANAAGDPGRVAEVGQAFLNQAPNSYTSPRWWDTLKGAAAGAGVGVGGAELLAQHPDVAVKLAAAGALAGGSRLGLNVARGTLGGAKAGARMITPPNASAVLQALIGANDNLIPSGVLAVKQAQQGRGVLQ